MMNWFLKPFEALSKLELYDILKARQEVFFVEQKIIHVDCDDQDVKALHFMGRDENSQNQELAAYTRVLPLGVKFEDAIALGRVLTRPNYRGQGLGREMMAELIPLLQAEYPGQTLRMWAQTQLKEFYQAFGFRTNGEPFLAEGVSHIVMEM